MLDHPPAQVPSYLNSISCFSRCVPFCNAMLGFIPLQSITGVNITLLRKVNFIYISMMFMSRGTNNILYGVVLGCVFQYTYTLDHETRLLQHGSEILSSRSKQRACKKQLFLESAYAGTVWVGSK